MHNSTMSRAHVVSLLTCTFLSVALFLTGCGSGGKLGGVSVTVLGLRSAQPGLQESQAVLTVRYVNENVVPVGLSGTRHKLYLNGTYVGQAVSSEAVGLPQLSTATRDVTVALNNAAMIGLLRGMAERPQAGYKLESVLYVIAGEEKLEIKTQSTGAVDLSGLRLN